MSDYEYENLYRQSRPVKALFSSTGLRALLLAIALGLADFAVLSGLASAGSIGEMAILVRLADVLTLGAVVAAAVAAGSALSFLTRGPAPRAARVRQLRLAPVPVKESDVIGVRARGRR